MVLFLIMTDQPPSSAGCTASYEDGILDYPSGCIFPADAQEFLVHPLDGVEYLGVCPHRDRGASLLNLPDGRPAKPRPLGNQLDGDVSAQASQFNLLPHLLQDAADARCQDNPLSHIASLLHICIYRHNTI